MAQKIEVPLSVEATAATQKRPHLTSGIAVLVWLLALCSLGAFAWSVPRSNQSHELENVVAGLQRQIEDLDSVIAQTTSDVEQATAASAAEIVNQGHLSKDLSASRREMRSLQKDVHKLKDDIAAAQAQQQQPTVPGPAPSVPPLNCHAVYLDTDGDGTVDKVELVCD